MATEPKVRRGRAGWPQKGLEAWNKTPGRQAAQPEGAGAPGCPHTQAAGLPPHHLPSHPASGPAPAPVLPAPQTVP